MNSVLLRFLPKIALIVFRTYFSKTNSHLGLKITLKLTNISYTTARALFLDLCNEIVLKHQLYLKEQKEDIRKITIELHNQRVVPPNHMVQKYDSQLTIFINEITSEYCCEIREELGH